MQNVVSLSSNSISETSKSVCLHNIYMPRFIRVIFPLLSALVLCGCHYQVQRERHYTTNFNFVVIADSISLQVEKPMHNDISHMVLDTVYVVNGDPLVVAQIAVIPEDSVDSVWVKVARDQMTMGWIHESDLLPAVVPNDPISMFIHLFSQRHLWWFVSLIGVVGLVLLVRRMYSKPFRMVHFNDIASIYPTLLCLSLCLSTLIYTGIQKHVPETWVQFYFHPTLNPFDLPLVLGAFVSSVWLMIILLVTVLDEVRRTLPYSEAMLYLSSLMAVLMLEYLVFSLSATIYADYPILAVYAVWAIRRYWRLYRPRMICGACGSKMHTAGRCPKCGRENVV